MKKKVLVLAILSFTLFLFSNAQTGITNYYFSSSSGETYTEITGGTTLWTTGYNNEVSGAIPLGGNFTFGGVSFTACYVSSNGFLTFGAALGSTNYTPISSLGTTTGAISAFGQDGSASEMPGTSPSISYVTIGDEFILQYKDHANYYNRTVEKMNFQIRLSFSTGAVNIVYGTCTNAGTNTNGFVAQVGIRGNTTGWHNNVNSLRNFHSSYYAALCDWSHPIASYIETDRMVYYSRSSYPGATIPSGLKYSWVPNDVPPIRNFYSATGITDNSATINWNPPAGITTFNVRYRLKKDCEWTEYPGNPVTGSSATFTNLLPHSTYHAIVQSIGTSNSSWSYIPDQHAGSGTHTEGSFTTTGPPPVNDECISALSIGAVPLDFSIAGATQSSPGVSTCSATNPDVWFQFPAPASGTVTLILGYYSGGLLKLETFSGSCGALTSLGCSETLEGGNRIVVLNSLNPGEIYYVRVYGIMAIGVREFRLSATGAALPITIEYFRGTKQNSKNVLDWKVSCYNSPTVRLTLERSVDGRKYDAISTTTETSLRCLRPFNYNDQSPFAGINYYRLKAMDIDGKVSYSNVVALLNKDKGFEIVSLAPNPVKDEAILSVTSAEKTIMEIVVSDLSGKQISKQRLSLIAGNNQVPLNFRNVAAGTYQVTGLTADGQMKSLRFVKQ